MKIIQNILQKTGASKLWFVLVVVFIAVLNVSAVEAKSLKTGEEFKKGDGTGAIRIVSSDEVEIESDNGGIFLGKYTIDGERVRVVATVFGSTVVAYYKITSDGLVDEKGGKIFYSKTAFSAFTAFEEKRKRAEEVQRGRAKVNADLVDAAADGHTEIVKNLLAKGANANAKDNNGIAALYFAVDKNNTEIVKMLLAKGADANAKDNNGNTALRFAVQNNNTEIVKMLLEKGANANAKNRNGDGVLTGAANNNNTEIVKMLLSKGADVNAKNSQGNAALLFAVENINTEIVKMLLAKGADVNVKNSSGSAALVIAVEKNNTEIVKMLLAKGADVNPKNSSGSVALDFAVHNNNTEVVKMLLDNGADANGINENGFSVLLRTIINKAPDEIITMLIQKGGDVNAVTPTGSGWTPLLFAVSNEKNEIVKLLLEKGADVKAKNDKGMTPLMMSVMSKNPEIVKILLTKDVDVNAKSNDGYTALDYAAQGNTVIVEMLRDKGALAKFTVNGSEVADNKAGLIWRRCAEGMVYSGNTCIGKASIFTYEQALQYAAAQANSTGIAWRVPDKDELYGIINKNYSNPAIDSVAFPATPIDRFWSSSPYVGVSYYAWYVNFSNGDVYFGNRGSYVRLVRAAVPSSTTVLPTTTTAATTTSSVFTPTAQTAKFAFSGGEVIDNNLLILRRNKSSLIWRRCVEGMVYSGSTCTGIARKFTYEEALQHAKSEASLTGIAWRVPQKYELASIIDKSYRNPTIDPIAFPATPASIFWSSNIVGVVMPNYAFVVSFGYDNVGSSGFGNNYYVRLVRSNQ